MMDCSTAGPPPSGGAPSLLLHHHPHATHPAQGFFRLAATSKDERGACGVLTTSSSPTKKAGPGAVGACVGVMRGPAPHAEAWAPLSALRLARPPRRPLPSSAPPRPHPPPARPQDATNPDVAEICGYFGLSECPPRSACDCRWSFFGLFCLNWGCDPDAAAPEL